VECLRLSRDRETAQDLFESLINLMSHNVEIIDLVRVFEIDMQPFEDMWSSETEQNTFRTFRSLIG
jgi:hypothetical protein